MVRLFAAVSLTTVVSYIASFIVYGTFNASGLVQAPEGVTPARLLISFLIVKVGMAVGFVLMFRMARGALAGRWFVYAATWWWMFAIVEVGQALGPGYSWQDALGGVISETIYFPASAFLTCRLIGHGAFERSIPEAVAAPGRQGC